MYHFYLLESKLKVLMKNKRKDCWDVTLGLSALGSGWVWSAHRKGRKLTQRVNCGRLYYSCIIRSPWMWPGLSYFLLPNRIEQKWWDTTSEVTKNLCFPLRVLSWFFTCSLWWKPTAMRTAPWSPCGKGNKGNKGFLHPTAHEQLKPGFNHMHELQMLQRRDSPGGPEATPRSQCRGPGFDPWSGN